MPVATAAPKLLTPAQERFCELVLQHNNNAQAYREAYPRSSAKAAEANAARLIGNDRVAARIAELRATRSARTGITADAVLQRLWAIATADANELIEYRRNCCRYCYGTNHDYQRTKRERDLAEASAREMWEKRKEKNPTDVFAFNEAGGIGWDPRRDPNPECPECFGEGEPRTFFKDTRKLSPAALALYGGVKETKEGLEIKTMSQQDALKAVGQHLGMFTEKHEHTGKDGQPLNIPAAPQVFLIGGQKVEFQ